MSFLSVRLASKSAAVKGLLALLCFCTLMLMSSSRCLATPLAVGGTVDNSSSGFSANKPVGGSVVSSQNNPFSTGTFSGRLISQVISGDTSNPFGGYTFTYLLQSDGTSTNDLHRLTLDSFPSLLNVDASYLSTGSDVVPFSDDRSSVGNVIGINFLNAAPSNFIGPGSQSRLLVFQTNSNGFQTASASVIDGSTATVNALLPTTTTVPEPSAVLLGLLGTVGLGWCAARRNKRRC